MTEKKFFLCFFPWSHRVVPAASCSLMRYTAISHAPSNSMMQPTKLSVFISLEATVSHAVIAVLTLLCYTTPRCAALPARVFFEFVFFLEKKRERKKERERERLPFFFFFWPNVSPFISFLFQRKNIACFFFSFPASWFFRRKRTKKRTV